MIHIIFIIVVACGACIQGIAGMGFSMICLTVLSFVLPYKQLMVGLKLLSLLFILPVMMKSRPHIKFKVMIVPMITGLIGSLIGYKMFIVLSGPQLSKILSVVLIIISVMLLTTKKPINIKPSFTNGSIAGVTSGMLAGACNVSGPPLAIYYVNAIKEDKEGYFATITMHFFILGVFQIAVLLFNGDVYTQSIKMSAIGVAPALIGFFTGRKIFKYVKPDFIKKCVYMVMLVMGTALFIKNM